MIDFNVTFHDHAGLSNGCTKYILDSLGNEIVIPIHVRHLSEERSDYVDVYPYIVSYEEEDSICRESASYSLTAEKHIR
jgi:hypothetical protein